MGIPNWHSRSQTARDGRNSSSHATNKAQTLYTGTGRNIPYRSLPGESTNLTGTKFGRPYEWKHLPGVSHLNLPQWGYMATGLASVAVEVSKLFPTLHSVQDQEHLPTHAHLMDEILISKYKRHCGQKKE